MSQKPLTNNRDFLGDLPDKIIASIFEYVQHGDREGLVLPFTTKLEEAEGIQEGLTEDEFFFLLGLYEHDGDQLLADCMVIDEAEGGTYQGPRKAEKGEWPRGDRVYMPTGRKTVEAEPKGYEFKPLRAPIKEPMSFQDRKKIEQAEILAHEYGNEYKKLHQDDIWFKTMDKYLGKTDTPEVIKRMWKELGDKEEREITKLSQKERKHFMKLNQMMRQLALAHEGKDIKALKKQIEMEKKMRDTERIIQYRLFQKDRKRLMNKLHGDYPSFWRGVLFGKKGVMEPDYGVGILRRIGKMIKGAVVGWETDVDAVRVKRLQDKEGTYVKRRVPGAVQWVFGQRRLQGGFPKGPNEPLEGIRAHKAVKRYQAKGGIPGAIWRGTGFTLFGKRFYTGADWKESQLGREEAIKGIIHPWKEKGLAGPEARRAMKIFMKDIKAVDAELWRLKRDVKVATSRPPQEGHDDYKTTDAYYNTMMRIKQLERLRKQILMNKKTYVKYAKAAKVISAKLKKGKLKTADIAQSMKPLVPILAAAIVAAGIVWFKTRHSREMLRVTTNKVLSEANRRGMYISAAEVRRTIDHVLKSPQKIRQITHAIELARAGVAVSKAANLLADIVIDDLGISKMPLAKMTDLSPEPTMQGRHTGMLSVPGSLEPFSF